MQPSTEKVHEMAVNEQPVDRKRRSNITFFVVSFCLISSALLTLGSGLGLFSAVGIALATTYVTSCLSLATATTMAYITGSVIDYNGGIGGLVSKDVPSAAPKG